MVCRITQFLDGVHVKHLLYNLNALLLGHSLHHMGACDSLCQVTGGLCLSVLLPRLHCPLDLLFQHSTLLIL